MDHIDITEKSGTWRLTSRQIENRKTGEVRRLTRTPCTNTVAMMPCAEFIRKCAQAFESGEWPQTRITSGAYAGMLKD